MDDLTKQFHLNAPISRRRVFALGGSIAGGLVVASSPLLTSPLTAAAAPLDSVATSSGSLPVKQIEQIMEAPGTVTNGVLSIEIDRNDLQVTGPMGLPFKPAWEINGTFYFQSIGNGKAIMNADFCLLPEETNPFIDKLFQGGLTLMAFHQHFFNLSPMVFFQHFRGVGDPLQLAKAAIAAVKVTGTPLPQSKPSQMTPLPVKELASILGGTATVGGSGVVNVSIPRADTIYLAGIKLSPDTGVSVTVAFEPLDNNGQNGQYYAAAAPDYAFIASEVVPALTVSRAEGFEVHCLYNQETAEQPQLYFSHNLKTGNAVDLAKQISKVLDKMNVKRS